MNCQSTHFYSANKPYEKKKPLKLPSTQVLSLKQFFIFNQQHVHKITISCRHAKSQKQKVHSTTNACHKLHFSSNTYNINITSNNTNTNQHHSFIDSLILRLTLVKNFPLCSKINCGNFTETCACVCVCVNFVKLSSFQHFHVTIYRFGKSFRYQNGNGNEKLKTPH